MYLLILGLNCWLVIFLTASAWLAFAGSPHHFIVSLFAAIFAALVHGGMVALFLGGGKLIKEHIGRFNMPLPILDRLNRIYGALIPKAILGAWAMPVVGIVGGLAGNGYVPPWSHWSLAGIAYGYNLWLVRHEYVWLKRFHGIVLEVDRNLPPDEEMATAEAHPDYKADEVVLDAVGRARALLYIGLTVPVPYLGYRFIVGLSVGWMLVPTILVTLACLGGSAFYYRRARRAPA